MLMWDLLGLLLNNWGQKELEVGGSLGFEF